MGDLISRKAAIDAVNSHFGFSVEEEYGSAVQEVLNALPSAQPEIIRCKDCKYFERDHFEKTGKFPVPIVVAHEICMKWGNGCKSSVDGWCFMAERRTDSDGRI